MRQYQLAIVEDEPHTARYIQGIVEATNLFHIAAVCESAEELLTLEPFPDLDVLVTDVKMSGLTGLELLRELQTRLPQLCSIIISGYDSFEYARDAIRLNVSNYILKPISKDELTVALLHLYDQLSNLRQKSGEEYLNSLYQEGEQPLEQALSLPAPYYHVLMAAGMNDQNQLILRCRTLLALEKHPELQMCIYQYGFLILLGVGQADAPNRLEQSAATIAAWERDSGATALLLLTDRAVAREELKREVRHLFHAHQKNLVLGKSVVMRLSAARTPEANTKEEQALTEAAPAEPDGAECRAFPYGAVSALFQLGEPVGGYLYHQAAAVRAGLAGFAEAREQRRPDHAHEYAHGHTLPRDRL